MQGQQTLEGAELAMRRAREAPQVGNLKLVPKSVKSAALKAAEERGVRVARVGCLPLAFAA